MVIRDSGFEFAGEALDERGHSRHVRLDFSQPDTSIENACAESLVARLRDERLNENWFLSLKDAKNAIGSWL